MSYRTNDIMVLVLVMILAAALVGVGLLSRSPELMQHMWWLPVVLGAGILLGCLVGIGFSATQPTKIPCPYCKEKIVPKVRTGSGHLYLSRLDED
jgi:xanthine/uracil permease